MKTADLMGEPRRKVYGLLANGTHGHWRDSKDAVRKCFRHRVIMNFRYTPQTNHRVAFMVTRLVGSLTTSKHIMVFQTYNGFLTFDGSSLFAFARVIGRLLSLLRHRHLRA